MNELSKDAVSWLTVGDDAEGQRIDNFLVRTLKGVPEEPHLPDPAQRRGPREQGPRRPGRAARDRRRRPRAAGAHGGARARVAKPAAARRFGRILFEDEALIAIDKPAGLAVHGGSGIALGVIEQLRAARPEARFLELVHRLDRDTSGVLLVAKKRSALTALHAQLRDGDVDKRYLVLVRGPLARCEAQRVDVAAAQVLDARTASGASASRRPAASPRRSSAARRRGPTAIRRWRCSRPSSRPAARTRSACILRTSDIALAGDDKYGDFAWNRRACARTGSSGCSCTRGG